MELGLLYFSALDDHAQAESRRIAQVRRADALGLSFVSFPERHFDRFGGGFPNPLLHCAVAASHTSRIAIRTGSLIPALHHPLRLKEDLRVVDQLANGRLQLSLGSGWNPNDFAIQPARFRERREWLDEFIARFDEWYAAPDEESVNGLGDHCRLAVHPAPTSRVISLWLTISANLEAWRHAGRQGLNVLSHMENVDHEALGARIRIFREARREAGLDPAQGRVTILQHAAICESNEEMQHAESALRRYLEQALALERRAVAAHSTMSGNKVVNAAQLNDDEVLQDIVERAYLRYRERASLVCEAPAALVRLRLLEDTGVDEVACLLDFANDLDAQDRCLERLGVLQALLRQDDATKKSQLEAFCS